MGKYPINMLGVNLTYKCNLNCFMCGQRHMEIADIKRELNCDELCKFILESKKYGLKYGVYLWGGEPFLYSGIADLLEFLAKNKLFVTINTNGTKLEEYAELIVKTRVQRLIISIDGIGEVHDKIRGVAGNYDKVVKGINKINSLKKFLPIISTNTVVTSKNYNMLFDIIQEINQIKVNKMECQLPIYFSNECGAKYEERMGKDFGLEAKYWQGFVGDYSNVDVQVLCKELDKIRKEFGKKFQLAQNINDEQTIKYFNAPETIYQDRVCSLPFSQIHIEPNGDVVVCPDFPDYVFGNMYEESVEQLWDSKRINEFRESIKKNQLPICSRCCQFYQF